MSCGWKSKLAISLTPFIFLENKSGKCFAKYSFMIGVQTCFQFSGCKDYIFPGRSRLSKSAGSGLKFKTPPPSGSVFPGSLLSWVTALSGIWHFLPCGRIRASLVAMTCTHHVLKVKCWRMRTNIFFESRVIVLEHGNQNVFKPRVGVPAILLDLVIETRVADVTTDSSNDA